VPITLNASRRPPEGVHPPRDAAGYRATELRHPKQPLIVIPQTLSELTGPVYGYEKIGPLDHDLTRQHAGEPLGERIVVAGRVLDDDGRPIPHTLIEVWQANAAGRYRHHVDTHRAPLDPNFNGAGRAVTDAEGRYQFVTIKPGAYPWLNHRERVAAGAHSLFAARPELHHAARDADTSGRPPAPLDPIFNSIPESRRGQRLVSRFDLQLTTPSGRSATRSDIVLRGSDATLTEV
jgi:protocatechuate 3,4-dioxygenase beta subunit